ncbi:MAG: 30S ribosomal protein S12 methylthiotransferase RimO [Candidatus Riflebacteria bacterium]|nr:30S ribosomal protein S12 methylthiotransferase RimO [Candidatus Riflebacteria bacterium]
MKFFLISLGCPKNTSDSEALIQQLRDRGLSYTETPENADIALVNTCGFIRDAKEESLKAIMDVVAIKKQRPSLRVVAFGCLVKRYKKSIEEQIPELDALFPFFTGKELDSLIPKKITRPSPSDPDAPTPRVLTPSHIGFLKIGEGCNNRCAYCAIPEIRGPYHSFPPNVILQEAQRLATTGAKEVCVIAQDTTRYGTDFPNSSESPFDLLKLIRNISEISDIHWIRLHYLHPKRLNFSFIDELFNIPKVIPYFDIPFQHVSNRVLTLMNRGITKKELTSLLGHIHRNFKKAVIRTTFIVGFPGETDDDFKQLIHFIEDHPIDRLGAFPYSNEEGTPAFRIKPQVPISLRQSRLDELMTLQGILSSERNQRMIGKRMEFLVDRVENDKAFARTTGDAFEIDNETTIPCHGKNLHPGMFVHGRILTADAYDFTAELTP